MNIIVKLAQIVLCTGATGLAYTLGGVAWMFGIMILLGLGILLLVGDY